MKLEIGNLKLGKHKKDVDALPIFKFRISNFDIGIHFDNIRFFEKSVNCCNEECSYFEHY
ncbi:MAG: hypothetical protein B5M55_07975 [Desulfococcus sp. 4484_242]|nr:MAG: hypothetical protein B5M55_07975 [Desulfococcus sp. 4484_242]